MHTKRRPWRPQLTRAEMGRGWVFFALYLTVFPLSMGWVQRAFHGELPVAEANVVYYLLAATLVFLVFWTFLRHGFDLLLDWLPENLLPSAPGSSGRGCSICWSCSFLCRYRIPTRRATPSSLPSPRRPQW
ncbi:MAG: hypothetical protein ACLRIS_04280 [Flavonifractor plautii]